MKSKKKIILGSASPRRQQLLKAIFDNVEVQVKDTNEEYPKHLKAKQIALYLAEKKAKAFNIKVDELLLTADTIVWFNGESLGKPSNKEEALNILQKLSGRSHHVFTGVEIVTTKKQFSFAVQSEVWFRRSNNDELLHYITQFKPFDKAGSYGAQECLPTGMNPLSQKEKTFLIEIGKADLFNKTLASNNEEQGAIDLIEKIEGSYFNVMGLPIAELYEAMKKNRFL